ncbi:GAF domain-containing protein [Ectothiorhodospiraceae bacterium WFHF3C12]|nr:GAF domain-containing protein [Ectothiorhodospiraceae bacterium WFHF3C12]
MSHSFTINGLPGERAATELLLNVVDALTLEADFSRFFSRAADAARRLVGGDGAALILLNPAGRFEYQFFNGEPAERLAPFRGYRFDREQGIAGHALREGHSVHLEDYPASVHAMPEFVELGLKSNLAVPLYGVEGAVGVLAISWFRDRAGRLEPQRIMWVEKVAGQIAVACHIRRLEQRLAAGEPAANRRWRNALPLERRSRQPAA